MDFGLIFAWGPTPSHPEDARLLGAEEADVLRKLDSGSAFQVYVHAASIPELIAMVRTLGRDCTYVPFAERQALLRVLGTPFPL